MKNIIIHRQVPQQYNIPTNTTKIQDNRQVPQKFILKKLTSFFLFNLNLESF